jgi:tripartite motif-containing protein 71
VDRQCNNYVTDSQHFRILKLTPDGTVAAQWSMPGDRPASESSSPRGVAVNSVGNVYATDTPRDRVYKFSPQSQVVATWGLCPDGGANRDAKLPGRFISPAGIAVDGAGNVADTDNKRVERLVIVDFTLIPPPEE